MIPTADITTAFKDIDVAILVGAMPRREGMERKDLLKANVRIFKQQGEALNQHAKKTVKVFYLKIGFAFLDTYLLFCLFFVKCAVSNYINGFKD